ncbi:hypothetical protein TNCT_210021 [Trichonephila clavata]|uniref:Uncharacterized protein n=1 Tax=Trichonephila clavata TaxID=2740835 RepID=A0A8X6EZH7_TRICU|nr:hypothetical protein TNCT_210021 [Trichonephila clavata]
MFLTQLARATDLASLSVVSAFYLASTTCTLLTYLRNIRPKSNSEHPPVHNGHELSFQVESLQRHSNERTSVQITSSESKLNMLRLQGPEIFVKWERERNAVNPLTTWGEIRVQADRMLSLGWETYLLPSPSNILIIISFEMFRKQQRESERITKRIVMGESVELRTVKMDYRGRRKLPQTHDKFQ